MPRPSRVPRRTLGWWTAVAKQAVVVTPTEPRPYDYVSPVAIVPDRYGGTYSGGEWLAFPCEPWEVPLGPFSDVLEAATWWGDADAVPIGLGPTPDAAYADLFRRLKAVEPVRKYPPKSEYSGWMWTWELKWPDDQRRIVDRSWRGSDMGPSD